MTASISPFTCAAVMAKSAYTLYPNDAAEPSATSVSIFGAPWIKPLKPLIKNFWFMTITATVSRSCKSPIATWFPSKNPGSGHPHIICPIEKYMRITKNMSDAISLLRSFGVSLSTSASCAAFSCSRLLFALPFAVCVPVPFGLAP